MKRLLFIFLIAVSCQLDAHRKAFTFWINPVADTALPTLNLDIPRSVTYPVQAGTYRIVTDQGPTNKYVKFVFDGAIRQNWTDCTCLYMKNNEAGYDKLGCIDTKKVMQNNFHINL